MVAISIESVSKRFGSTVALDGVSLRIEAGELFFLLGPSGCGKTTLLRALAGFGVPDSGVIRFGDEVVTHQEPHRRNTGMVFQNYALWPHLTVFENVAFGLRERAAPAPEIERRVTEALRQVRMGDHGARRPGQLSGGQQQRVALARALVIRPRCLLLDEPLSNLDARLRLELRGEIRRICREAGLTAVYVTHDQKEALAIADRLAVMESGRLLQVGTPQEVYRRPASRQVAAFIGEANFLSGTVVRGGGGMAAVRTALGELKGVLSPDFEPEDGRVVTLCIRPEAVKLEPYPAEENGFAVRVEDVTYLGDAAQYHCRSGETLLRATESNPRFLPKPGVGPALHGRVDAEDVVVLPD